MLNRKIFIGADHRGFNLKKSLIREMRSRGYQIIDEGDDHQDPDDDYPQFASKVVRAILDSDVQAVGILLCGSGQGMAMAANRYKGIRAVVAWNKDQARFARNDDDSNVIALPADIYENDVNGALSIIETWLTTPYESIPRRNRRIKEMDEL